MKRYTFSKHAKARFRQRFSNLIVDNDITKTIARLISRAKPDRTFVNNTEFMVHMWETHGYDPVEFLVLDQTVFVTKQDVLVTVYDRRDSLFGASSSRFKSK